MNIVWLAFSGKLKLNVVGSTAWSGTKRTRRLRFVEMSRISFIEPSALPVWKISLYPEHHQAVDRTSNQLKGNQKR